MTREQAFKQGFLKKAAELKVSAEEVAACVKIADASQLWDQGKAGLSQLLQQGKDYVANTEFSNPEHAGRAALIGALGGGALGGAYSGVSNIGKKEEDKSSVLGSALQAALLGGVGGAATPYIKNYLEEFKPQAAANQTTNNVSVNSTTPAATPKSAPAPDVSLLGDNAPKNSRGNLAGLLHSFIPGGAMLANRNQAPGNELFNQSSIADKLTSDESKDLVGIPALGAASGAILGGKAHDYVHGPNGAGGGKYKALGALAGLIPGNILGNSLFRGDQEDKFSNVASGFLPSSILKNDNIPMGIRQQLADAIQNKDASRMLDGIRSVDTFTPDDDLPKQFNILRQLANKQNETGTPGWYNAPGLTQRIKDTLFNK